LSIPSLFLHRHDCTLGLPSLHLPNHHQPTIREQTLLLLKV